MDDRGRRGFNKSRLKLQQFPSSSSSEQQSSSIVHHDDHQQYSSSLSSIILTSAMSLDNDDNDPPSSLNGISPSSSSIPIQSLSSLMKNKDKKWRSLSKRQCITGTTTTTHHQNQYRYNKSTAPFKSYRKSSYRSWSPSCLYSTLKITSSCRSPNNKSSSSTFSSSSSSSILSLKWSTLFHHYLITCAYILLLLMILFLSGCYAQDSNDFALRPFPASLHSSTNNNNNNRRQDVGMFHHNNFVPIEIGGNSASNGGGAIVRHHHHHPTTLLASSSQDEPNLVPILTAPVPRGSSSNPRPSFQRIRLSNNNQTPASQKPPQSIVSKPPPPPPASPFLLPEEFVPVTLTESPAPNFPRLIGLNGQPMVRLAQTSTGIAPPITSPVSVSAPAPPPPSPQVIPAAPVIPSSPAVVVPPPPQRQSFRRIKPPSHANWKSKPKASTASPSIASAPLVPAIPVVPVEPSRVRVPATSGRLTSAAAAAASDNKLHGRGPISAQDEDLSHKPNALDNEDSDPGLIDRDRSSFYGNRLSTDNDNGILAIESLSRSSASAFEPVRTRPGQTAAPTTKPPSVVPTPTIPLTYYTTFTYYTTVIRGPHTAMLSREQVASSTQLKPIDRNIVTAIEFSDGYITPEKTSKVVLGTKTKGATTTIYNVASRVQVFNDDLYKVIFTTPPASSTTTKVPTPPLMTSAPAAPSQVPSSRIVPTRSSKFSPIPLESTQVMNRHSSKPAKPSTSIRLEQLQNQLKKQLALLTYYYTLIEGTQTQYSTRVEESTTNYNGDLSTLIPSMAPSIDSYGLLKIIAPSSIVPLGSRANGESTTVVNLAMNNYIKFNKVKDVQIDIMPTATVSEQIQPTHIVSSMDDVNTPTMPTSETPKLDSSSIMLDQSSSSIATPSLSLTITPSETSTTTPTRTTSSGRRPGVRIKLKPIRSKLNTHLSRHASKSSESPSSSTSEEPIQTTSIISTSSATSDSLLLTPTIVDQTPVLATKVDSSESFAPGPQRKKVAFTIRRPGSSGVNRFFSRRPSSHLLYPFSSSPVVSSSATIQSTSIVPSSSISPSAVLQSSSSTLVPSMSTPSLSSEHVLSYSSQTLSPSPVWTQSSTQQSIVPSSSIKTSKNRLVVLTRLAGAINKWSPMYNSRVRVSSRRLIKSTQPAMDPSSIEPTSPTFETMIYETTTHTVPFTIGSTVTYTTVEETNSRILADPIMDTLSPSIEDLTRTSSQPSPVLKTVPAVSQQPLASSYVIVETSDVMTTSTLYSTYTYFATLFNGTQTSITPLEEVKTEYLTLREPVTITRTIIPSVQFTKASTMPTISSQVVYPSASTISLMDSMEPMKDNEQDAMTRLVTETYSTQTTLTHFITLFSGSHTILSSIEEISPTVMTRTRYVTPYTLLASSSTSNVHTNIMSTMTPVQSSSVETSTAVMPNIQDTLTPSPPVTTPGSISYETGSGDGDIYIIDQAKPNQTQDNKQPNTLEPGSVIELEDLLEGVQDAGPIGETIKDIVKDIFKEEDETTTTSPLDTTTQPTGLGIDTTPVSPSFTTSSKATPSLNRFPVYNPKSKHYDPAKDHSNDDVIFSTQSGDETPVASTRYVTSIEKSIRTLTLTSTKVYYTRDSPLTITSVLTTTLPPITYVSTIIGSKTILGTYNSITPTKTIQPSTMMVDGTRSTQIAPSTPVQPQQSSAPPPTTASSVPSTHRPRLHRPKQQDVPKAKIASILNSGNRGTGTTAKPNTTTKSTLSTTTGPTMVRNNLTTNAMLDSNLQLCDPQCNVTNKEYCRESEFNHGIYSCECRPGYVRRPSDNLCQEIKNYLVTVRVSKTAESEVQSTSGATDGELQKYARVARRQVMKADGIAGLQVLSVEHTTRSKGALVNLTIQLDHKTNQDELSKKLEPLGRVEKVVDFDECSSPLHNDCSPRARCINEPGSYSCQCFEPFIDLDRTLPGRLCVTEIKSCDYCHGRGDCWRNNSDMVCRCHPMFIGRRCEINGLLLAILVPIVAILVIIAIVCFFYCSRKLRQRNRRFKNLAAYGPVAVIGGTLDRKAMLETSSESSDPQHRSSHYTSESNPASARGSMARRHHHHQSRRESEPSLDRSLASYNAAAAAAAAASQNGTLNPYNTLPHQIVIPRARPTYALHPGQVYMW